MSFKIDGANPVKRIDEKIDLFQKLWHARSGQYFPSTCGGSNSLRSPGGRQPRENVFAQ